MPADSEEGSPTEGAKTSPSSVHGSIVAWRFLPSGYFGDPEKGVGIQPAGVMTPGPPIPIPVKPGRISLPAESASPIFRLRLDVGETTVEFRGSTVIIRSPDPALGKTDTGLMETQVFRRFIQDVSRGIGQHVYPKLLGVGGSEDTLWYPKLPLRVRSYHLKSLEQSVRRAAQTSLVGDAKSDKARMYLQHAQFLASLTIELSPEVFETTPKHASLFVADVALNSWKAISVLLGEKWHEQGEALQTMGLAPPTYEERFRRLKRLRNEGDVAHARQTENELSETARQLHELIETAKLVLDAYLSYLMGAGSST